MNPKRRRALQQGLFDVLAAQERLLALEASLLEELTRTGSVAPRRHAGETKPAELAPSREEQRALTKDWLTALLSVGGVLLTAVLAALAILYGRVEATSWRVLLADATAGVAVFSFVAMIILVLLSLGYLVTSAGSAAASSDPNSDEQKNASAMLVMAAKNALWANRFFNTGVIGTVSFGVAAIIVVNAGR
jgi:hypothetical protein